MNLEVGGYLSTLSFKAIREIDHDLILGMDFLKVSMWNYDRGKDCGEPEKEG